MNGAERRTLEKADKKLLAREIDAQRHDLETTAAMATWAKGSSELAICDRLQRSTKPCRSNTTWQLILLSFVQPAIE
jgi:hypothetical protein